MRFRDPPRDGETEARAAGERVRIAGPRLVGAHEALEHVRLHLGRYAVSRVLDPVAVLELARLEPDRRARAGRRVLDGVVEQVEDDAAEQPLVAHLRRLRHRRHLDTDASCLGE